MTFSNNALIIGFLLVWIAGGPAAVSGSAPPPPELTAELICAKAEFQRGLAAAMTAPRIGNRDYDAREYTLDFQVDPDTQSFAGTLTMSAAATSDALDAVTLDMGDNLNVITVTNGASDLVYAHSAGTLDITLDRLYETGEMFTVAITYDGTPAGYSFNFTDHSGTPVFATICEPIGSREWWPCNDVPDDKALVSLNITVPDWMVVASNGLLTADTDNGDGTRTFAWHHSYPVSTYLVAIAGTNYEMVEYEYTPVGGGDPMPVPVYAFPERLEFARVDFADTVTMIEFFADYIGEYPFVTEKYGQVLSPNGGGMEHQTITHISGGSVRGRGNINGLIAHELAHSWWGDCITLGAWEHIWLNESFATYSDALYQEYAYGADHLKALMSFYETFDYEGSIYDPDYLFSYIVYYKGAWVLHMLRHMTGDDVFRDILRTYYADQRYAYSNALTDDFIAIAESVSGMELDGFFDQWIFGIKRPDLELTWDYTPSGQGYELTVQLDQVQTDYPVFHVPVEMDVVFESGRHRIEVDLDEASETFTFQIDEPPVYIDVDPDVWLLKYLHPGAGQFQFTDDPRLPAARFSEPYSETLEILNGDGPVTYELYAGALPRGITLNSTTGELSGFPLESGTHYFSVLASDSRTPPRHALSAFSLRCTEIKASIELPLNLEEFHGGDSMIVTLELHNETDRELTGRMFVVLELSGTFQFLDYYQDAWPAFSTEPVMLDLPMNAGFNLSVPIIDIPLPSGLTPFNGQWYGLLLSPENGTALGPLTVSPFEYN